MPRRKTGAAYEVLNCRVPPGIIARINAHAELHGQRVRDVVAAALLAYLDSTQVTPLELPAAHVVRQAQQRLSEALKLLGTVLSPRRAAVPPTGSRSVPAVGTQDVTPQPDEPPAYDFTKFYLGKLCPRAHKWDGRDTTLRRINGSKCDVCENEGKRRRREAAGQTA